MAGTFKSEFCRAAGCEDSNYERTALRHFLHRPWNWLIPALSRLNPGAFRSDLQILTQLGRAASAAHLRDELKDLHMDYLRRRDYGVARKVFRIRLSRRSILKSARGFWP